MKCMPQLWMFNMSYEHHEQPVSARVAVKFVCELAMWTRWRLFVSLFVLTKAFPMPLSLSLAAYLLRRQQRLQRLKHGPR
jgi:hypothetical protein